jgi:putative salt-induced outer membrane protein YdiY
MPVTGTGELFNWREDMRTPILKGALAALLLPLTLLPGCLLADQLIMKNGDVITGDIASIDDSKVTIKPAYADEFAVNLADVAAVEADQVFDVVLEDGREVEAQFAGADGEQQALIVEEQPMMVAIEQIKMAEEPPPYYERTSRVDLNMTLRDGNTDSANNLLYAETRMRFGVNRHLGDLTIAREETDGDRTKEQDLLRYEYHRLLDGPWYVGATASYESDPIKDLDHRYKLGGLVGRDIFDDDVQFLTVSLGPGWSEEELGGVTESGAVGNNNGIFKSNTGFRFDIVKNVYTAVSLRYDYETEPAPDAKSYDTTLTIGVGSEF